MTGQTVYIAAVLLCLAGAACDGATAKQARLEAARAACYELPEPQVFSAVYDLLAARYPIAHSSAPRGTIDTERARGTVIHAEIVHDYTAACVHEFGCYRVRVHARGAEDAERIEQELQLAVYRRLTGR